MSQLAACPTCSRAVSENAERCPHCGEVFQGKYRRLAPCPNSYYSFGGMCHLGQLSYKGDPDPPATCGGCGGAGYLLMVSSKPFTSCPNCKGQGYIEIVKGWLFTQTKREKCSQCGGRGAS